MKCSQNQGGYVQPSQLFLSEVVDATKLDVFLHKSLRRIMKIYWPMKTSNEEIRNRANISTISEQIFRRRWKFIGHILRMDPSKHLKTALTWAPEGRRRRGRLGAELPRGREQLWGSVRGVRRRRLLVTVRHCGGECPALYPPRVMV